MHSDALCWSTYPHQRVVSTESAVARCMAATQNAPVVSSPDQEQPRDTRWHAYLLSMGKTEERTRTAREECVPGGPRSEKKKKVFV